LQEEHRNARADVEALLIQQVGRASSTLLDQCSQVETKLENDMDTLRAELQELGLAASEQ